MRNSQLSFKLEFLAPGARKAVARADEACMGRGGLTSAVASVIYIVIGVVEVVVLVLVCTSHSSSSKALGGRVLFRWKGTGIMYVQVFRGWAWAIRTLELHS